MKMQHRGPMSARHGGVSARHGVALAFLLFAASPAFGQDLPHSPPPSGGEIAAATSSNYLPGIRLHGIELAPRMPWFGIGLDKVIAEQQIQHDFAAPVRVAGPVNGNVLTFNGANWVAGTGGGGAGPTTSNWATVLGNTPLAGQSGGHNPIITTGDGMVFGTGTTPIANTLSFGGASAQLAAHSITVPTGGGSGCEAFGQGALLANQASLGNLDTALGHNALTACTTGSNNTAVGHSALSAITTGGNDTALGQGAGATVATISNTTCLGTGCTTAAGISFVAGTNSTLAAGATESVLISPEATQFSGDGTGGHLADKCIAVISGNAINAANIHETVSMGWLAIPANQFTVNIGANTFPIGGDWNILLGAGASDNTLTSIIALGAHVKATAAHQFIVGGENATDGEAPGIYTTNMLFNGAIANPPGAVLIRASDSATATRPGDALVLAGGLASRTADASGVVSIQTCPAGSDTVAALQTVILCGTDQTSRFFGQAKAIDGTAGAPAYTFTSDTSTGIIIDGTSGHNGVALTSGGTKVFTASDISLGTVGGVTFACNVLSAARPLMGFFQGLLLGDTQPVQLASSGYLRWSSTTDGAGAEAARWLTGSGSPAGVVTASPGSLYTNTAGGAGTTLYLKETGTSTNTGWVAYSSGGSSSLQSAYNGGATIATSGATAIAFSDTNADTGDVLTINKAPSSVLAGNGITITQGANSNGIGLSITSSATSATSGGPLSVVNNSTSLVSNVFFDNSGANNSASLNVRKDPFLSTPPVAQAGHGLRLTMGGNGGVTSGNGLDITMTTGQASGTAIGVTGGTVTTSAPVFDATQTWNAGGVAFSGFRFNVTNTASAAGSQVFELQRASNDILAVAPSGATVITGTSVNRVLTAQCNQNDFTQVIVANSTAGTTAASELFLLQDTNLGLAFLLTSASYTGNGAGSVNQPAQASVSNNVHATNGMAVYAQTGPLILAVHANTPDSFAGSWALPDNNSSNITDLRGVAGSVLSWTDSTSDPTSTVRTGISQISNGVLGFGTGANGSTAANIQFNTVTKYGGVATAGIGVPAIYGIDFRQGRTSADGAAITLYTAVNGTSVFRISADIFATAFTSGTATYTIAWTQNGSAQSLAVTAAALNTLGTATDLINPDNGTAITARLTGTFTATVTVTALVEQLK